MTNETSQRDDAGAKTDSAPFPSDATQPKPESAPAATPDTMTDPAVDTFVAATPASDGAAADEAPAAGEAPAAVVADAAPASVLVSMRAITRRFGTLTANDAIDLQVNEGEIVALIGDNGAGKTTLMNILCGHDLADSGEVLVAGTSGLPVPLAPGSPRAAIAAGIRMVQQPAELADNLTALENIMLGTQSLWRPRLSRRAARKRIADLMQRLGLRVALDVPLVQLPADDQMRVAILRAFYPGVRVLILDEPTAVLTPPEVDALFSALKTLARDGLAAIITSRKPDEALAFADRAVVLRGGRMLADLRADGVDRDNLAALIWDRAPPQATASFHFGGEPVLELRKVDVFTNDGRPALRQASLEVHAGEIVGIAGVAGNGQDGLEAVVAGINRPSRGDVFLYGRRLVRFDAAAFARAGVGRIPHDRQRDGVVPSMSIAENLVLGDVNRLGMHRAGLLRRKRMTAHAAQIIADFGLQWPRPSAPVASLPNGAVARLLLARVLDRKPRLLLVDRPTRGLDADMASEVRRQLDLQRSDGAAILLLSDDIDELFALADSISVIHRGRITVPQPTGAFDRTRLGLMMGSHGSLAQDGAGWGEST